MNASKRDLLIALLVLGFAGAALAAKDPIYTARGAAIGGYDPVAYFDDGKPVKGDERFTHEWNGATWRFASAEHRDTFAAAPEKYAPQYGGYCAYAVSQGRTAKIDPDAWTIRDGKLYLNYDASIQKKWLKNVEKYIADADRNWPGVLD